MWGRCDHYFESVPELSWVSEQSGGRPVPTPVVEGKREGWGSVGGHGGTLRCKDCHPQKQKVPAWEGAGSVPHAPMPGLEARTGSRLGVDPAPSTPVL